MSRAHNFCAGPCTLPESVIAELADELPDYRETGTSVIEMSHRSPDYEAIHLEALDLLRSLYSVPDDFDVLLVQGGATLQFAMVPMNLLAAGENAGYVMSGAWARKALDDAAKVGNAYTAWAADVSTDAGTMTRMPSPDEVMIQPGSRYLHITSNETIEGVRFTNFDGFDARLVADMSSDYLSRPIDWDLFDLVYGGAQKNLGPAGLAVVFVRSSIVEQTPEQLPAYLRYDTHAKSKSLANTPSVFAIWAMGKVLRWMADNGGVAAMEKRAAMRSAMVYDLIDGSGDFYRNPVEPRFRSHMNVVFRLPTEELEKRFLAEAASERLLNLPGHRSVGGVRASIYNGLPTESVETLTSFMSDFAAKAR
ncbi:MAG: 3-phosphoserine/phosphohydroxythreonine transaminase [Acidimicrobiales bacterium]